MAVDFWTFVVVGVGAWTIWTAWRRREPLRQITGDEAPEGAPLPLGTRVEREVDRLAVRLSARLEGGDEDTVPEPVTRVVVTLPPGVPRMSVERTSLGGELAGLFEGDGITLDDALLERGLSVRSRSPEAARAVFRDVRVIGHLADRVERGADVHIEEDGVRMATDGHEPHHVRALVSEATTLARVLGDAVRKPLEALATQRGLTVSTFQRSLLLTGELEGRPVHLRVGHERGAYVEVRVTTEPLPGRLVVTRGEGGLETGDPILTGTLCIETSKTGATVALVTRDDVRERLMEVVHGHPGSDVRGDQVVLRVDDADPRTIGELLERAVGLAVVLSS